ncbi:unnamed protein product [Malus baccata var. baccata]
MQQLPQQLYPLSCVLIISPASHRWLLYRPERLQSTEAYFTLGNFDFAIMQARAFDSDLHGMDNYMIAYQIHATKQYKRLALALHLDKNGSITVEGAFKHAKEAWDVLFDAAEKEAYDKSLS